MQRAIKDFVKKVFPATQLLLDWQAYRRATQTLTDQLAERTTQFDAFVERSIGHPSMQVGVRGQKYAPHWVSVDLYDMSPLIDYHYDVQDMPFADGEFRFVACNAVLEHIPYPQQAIAEFLRILQPGGEVWVEVPFNQPYHAHPGDYWRVTTQGMRIWMAAFDEVACGLFSPHHNSLYNGIYFHGRKPLAR